jgi:hypothetical protein
VGLAGFAITGVCSNTMAVPAAWDTNLILFSEMLTFSPQNQTKKSSQNIYKYI